MSVLNTVNIMAQRKRIESRITLDIDRMMKEFAQQWNELTPAQRADFDRRLDEAYPGGFNERDEANALIAMAVRNGPLEELHAGTSSPLLDDPSLSRISDDEMKTLMLHGTRMLAALLQFREADPELYRRWIRTYGNAYCNRWERER